MKCQLRVSISRFMQLAFISVSLPFLSDNTSAQCVQSEDVVAFRSQIREVLTCQKELLRGKSCNPPKVQACAREAKDEIVQTLFSNAPNAPAAYATSAGRCQAGIELAAIKYLQRRVAEKYRGQRSAPRRQFIRKVEKTCAAGQAANLPGGRFPAIGGRCSYLFPAGTNQFNKTALAECLVATLEKVVDDNVGIAPNPPNFVVVLTDDQRPETLDSMPHVLNEIAARGTTFTNGFVTTSSCCPSRVSLYTGLYARKHGVLTNAHIFLPNNFDIHNMLGKWLRDVGYRTGFFGKLVQLGGHYRGVKPEGWDEWQHFLTPGFYNYQLNINGNTVSFGSAPEDYSTDYLRDRAVEFIKRNRRKPFMLIYAPYAPHEPATPADRHAHLFTSLEPWVAPNVMHSSFLGKPTWVRAARYVVGNAVQFKNHVEAVRKLQYQSLAAVDEAVKALSDALERSGVSDNTVFIFLSDNGFHWGENWWKGKFTSYDSGIRVPYLIRHPLRSPEPKTSDALVLNIDIAPTLTALAGASAPAMDGENIAPVFEGVSTGRDAFMFENATEYVVTPSEGIRTHNWKYIRNKKLEEDELFNLVADPFEMNNLAADAAHQSIKSQLIERLEILKTE